jgi:micrococcal nuclease
MKEKIKKIYFFIIIGALIIGGSIYFLSKQVSLPPLPERGIVTKVIDGDTIIIEGKYKIRLLGIDADEIGQPCYEITKSRLEEMVLNKEVILENDQIDKDQYGRFLRYIFINNQNVNLQLVEEGLATPLFYESNLKYKEEITKTENEAKINKIGCKWRK